MQERNVGILEQILEELQALRQEIANFRAVLPVAVNSFAAPATDASSEPEPAQPEAFPVWESALAALHSAEERLSEQSASVNELLDQHPKIRDWLRKCGLQVKEFEPLREVRDDALIARQLALFIAKNFEVLSPFYEEIRCHLDVNYGKRFYFNLTGQSERLISVTNHVCRDLQILGYVKFTYTKGQGIDVRITNNTDGINFLSGGWFEQAVLELLSKHPHWYSECLHRVKARHNLGAEYEFDCLLATPGGIRMLECKSGKNLPYDGSAKQIARAVKILRLTHKSAVITPLPLDKGNRDKIESETGAKALTFCEIEEFLTT